MKKDKVNLQIKIDAPNEKLKEEGAKLVKDLLKTLSDITGEKVEIKSIKK